MQSKHFGNSTSVSIEGYTCHYPSSVVDDLVMDFHSYLSDGKVQHASTVHNHLDKLLQKLKEQGHLADGGRVLCFTDGCASQYRSATSLYFMALLSVKYQCVIDRGISAAGHGKSLVDAINGVDKNTILRRLMRAVQDAEDAAGNKTNSLQVQSFNNTSDGTAAGRYSAAADCKRILEEEGGQGVKSAGLKYEKREKNRGINQRYWEVRGLDEKLSKTRCATIKIPEKGVTFKDMYHFYTCKELGANEKKIKVALRRIPCSCDACDEMIRKPWVPGKPANEQPRFADVPDCYFRPVLGDANKWYIVDLKELEPNDELDAEEARESQEESYKDVLHHIASYMAEKVVVGELGAVACDDEEDTTDGYYLVRFTSLPYPDQSGSGEMKIQAKWLYEFPGAKKWFYEQEGEEMEVNLMHVVGTGIVMNGIAPNNQPPGPARKKAREKNAIKISDDYHNMIIDEIYSRERLEYDPTRVLVGEEEEENFSDDEE